VVGLPDDKWGQVVTAYVVRTDDDLTPERIDAFCKARDDLAPYKRPKKYVFMEALPTNPSGKVLKRELVAAAGQ
jgi:fatty-acyl-CoA synthase